MTRKVIETDANGNRIVEESFIDPLTGEKVVIKKTVKKDAYGNVNSIIFFDTFQMNRFKIYVFF